MIRYSPRKRVNRNLVLYRWGAVVGHGLLRFSLRPKAKSRRR